MPRKRTTGTAPMPAGAVRRCAIYTRKSSEEGLEQAFNSLQAQREACQAFIASQRHEGWRCLPALYDDGGISGGTMERPALKHLLADIQAGKVDLVVVYKVDRLTRSLADFAKIVEIFDARNVSFVSVTQQFNTTTSMGRLTLNMLLSFAQFEREVTGERIRDKIAASKRKGMWMGGLPPLGYDVRDRKLVVNEPEAEIVRRIFRGYLVLFPVRALKARLDDEGVTSKTRRSAAGRATGGRPLTCGNLYRMLQNRTYLGEVTHGESVYPGEHAAIVEPELWNEVQARLAQHRQEQQHSGKRVRHPSLLAGVVFDAAGARLVPSHAVARGRRYRYYVSQPLVTGTRAEAGEGQRIPAADLERLVTDRLLQLLASATEMAAATEVEALDAPAQGVLLNRAADLARRWSSMALADQRRMLSALIHRIQVRDDGVEIEIHPRALCRFLSAPAEAATSEHSVNPEDDGTRAELRLTVPVQLRRAGLEMRLVIDGPGQPPQRDNTLVRLIARAHRMRNGLIRDPEATLSELAEAEGVTRSYFTRVVRLAFIAPDITAAILEGRHPPGLTVARLLQDSRLPLAWDQQRAMLGFA